MSSTSSRKVVGKSKLKQGQRKSPRLSALGLDAINVASKKTHTQQSRRVVQTPTSQSRSRSKSKARASKITKLRPPDHVAAPPSTSLRQDSNQHSHEDHPISSDQPTSQGANGPIFDDKAASPDRQSCAPYTDRMPEKRTLEHIIDILQRRDTYEIFAEPVDPEEVEEYYEIIKEPMDFGTMRAKLHEGMYTSLQQFEHDVYLISGNAMYFNSSSTIYFRQGRAIHELAKKVFHTLKTDPDNLELELSETRRRTSRRLMSQASAPSYISSPKIAKNLRPNSKTNKSSKTMPSFLHDSSNLRKSTRGIGGVSGAATDTSARNHEVHSRAINGWRNSIAEVDRHRTPWMSLLTENDSIVSSVYSGSKTLIPVNQQEIGYRDSLMLFVKDLGPTAQKVAKLKLIGCSVDASSCWSPGSKHLIRQPECQNHNAFDYVQTQIPILETAESKTLIDHLHRVPTISGNANYKVDAADAGDQNRLLIHNNISLEVSPSCNQSKIPVSYRGDAHTSKAISAFGLLGYDRLHQDQHSENQLDSNPSNVGARESNLLVSGFKSNCYNRAPQLESSSSAQPQENMLLDSRSRNNFKLSPSWHHQTMGSTMCSETKGSRPFPRSGGQDITAEDEVEVSGSVETGQEWKARRPTPLAGSQFTFDLPYLRKRLGQINSFGSIKMFQQ